MFQMNSRLQMRTRASVTFDISEQDEAKISVRRDYVVTEKNEPIYEIFVESDIDEFWLELSETQLRRVVRKGLIALWLTWVYKLFSKAERKLGGE